MSFTISNNHWVGQPTPRARKPLIIDAQSSAQPSSLASQQTPHANSQTTEASARVIEAKPVKDNISFLSSNLLPKSHSMLSAFVNIAQDNTGSRYSLGSTIDTFV